MARPKRVFRGEAPAFGISQEMLDRLGIGNREYNLGLFGIPAIIDVKGTVRIKVNVRTDQEYQRKLAKLDPSTTVLLVDCPGGAVAESDTNAHQGLAREISEETAGCTITEKGEFSDPLEFVPDDPTKLCDIAQWKPVLLHGVPKSSNEALDHPWVSRAELEAAATYRAVSGLGLRGRTGRMMTAALDFYENNKDKLELFS